MAGVFVITGPSGVGKGTLIAALRARHPELGLSVSATTRPPRPGEEDGVAYHFLSESDFDRRLARGEFVEHASYAGHRYGTLRAELERRARGGAPVVLEIELQGARQVRAAMPEAVLIFIAPSSLEQLEERLRARGSDVEEALRERLEIARTELAAREEFGFVVVNDELARAIDELDEIYLRYAE
jgi:guanylate kinase